MIIPPAYGQGQMPTFIDAVTRGEVTNQLFERKFASANIGTVEQPIWAGGATYEFIDTPEAVNIVSDNLNDTLAGTGAQKVKVIGLNAGVITTEIIDLDGTTPVAMANQYDFIHRMFIVQAGSTSPVIPAIAGSVGAAGNITATGVTSSAVRAVITNGNATTLQTPIRVPIGERWQIHDVTVTAGKGQEVNFQSYIRIPGTKIFAVIARGQLVQETVVIPSHRVLTAGTDLIFTAFTSAGNVETSILIQMTREGATEELI